jgi:hypothetical protein
MAPYQRHKLVPNRGKKTKTAQFEIRAKGEKIPKGEIVTRVQHYRDKVHHTAPAEL